MSWAFVHLCIEAHAAGNKRAALQPIMLTQSAWGSSDLLL